MNTKRLQLPLALAFALLALAGALALLGAWSSRASPVQAGPLPQLTPTLPPIPLLPPPSGGTRYVAPTGVDVGDCVSPTAPCKTIQYAVNQANDGEEIHIATFDVHETLGPPPSIITITARYTDINTMGGHPQVIYLNKSVTLRGGYIYSHILEGHATWLPSPVPAQVDAHGAGRCLYVTGNVTPTLELLSFVNGDAAKGGNVYIEGSRARLLGIRILNGTAQSGGGLYLKRSFAFLSLLSVENNTATDGGGLYIEGGHPIIAGGFIQQNIAERYGGGFYLDGSAANIAAATIVSNTAASAGGGFYLDGPIAFSEETVPIIANNYIRHNRVTGSQGGGLYFHQSIAGLVNNVIADNQATDGAAMYLWASSPQLYHNTIAKNSGSTGLYVTHRPGSLWPPLPPIPSRPTFTNTILVSHTTGIYVASTGLPDPLQNKATLKGTLWWGNTSDTAGPGLVVHSTDVYSDPLFTCTGDVPACLRPYHILTDSPAVDTGVSVGLVLPIFNVFVDIDGNLRPSGSGFDIGADEVRQRDGLYFFLPISVLPAAPGQTVTHTHLLMNTGTETDTLALSYHSSTGWATLLGPTTIELGAQTSTTVQVRVTVPATATSDMRDTTVITATSQSDPSRQAHAWDVTAVITQTSADLVIGKWVVGPGYVAPGRPVTFTLAVTNAGPLTDTLVVTIADTLVPTEAISAIGLPAGCAADLAQGLITCTLTLPGGTPPLTLSLTIVITTSSTYTDGPLLNRATVFAVALDPTPSNNIVGPVAVKVGHFRAIVHPDRPATLTYTDTQGHPTIAAFPPGAVTDTVTIIYTPLASLPHSPPQGLSFADHAFELAAHRNDVPVPGFRPVKPYTIAIEYSDEDVAGLIEDALELHRWDGAHSRWATEGISVIQRDTANNQLVALVNHLGEFALFDQPWYNVYLPVVLKNYTSGPPPATSETPNDPRFDDQWALETINAEAAWPLSKGDNILIAVLDTGADLDHPDLTAKLRTDIDRDFINNDNVADDDQGHGTHVSGIAAAATDNSTGVAGLGWNAAILPLKVMDDQGGGDTSALINAIYYAADNGVKVINMSLGTDPARDLHCSTDLPALQTAINYAYNKGVVMVAAAGNESSSGGVAPANCTHVIGVAATNRNDKITYYSNYGDSVDVAAPGGAFLNQILSTCMGGGYCEKSGTSMATPYVAGLAALVFARYPSYTPDQVAAAIMDNAVDLGDPGWDAYYGCGRIDAEATVKNGAPGATPACRSGPWTQERPLGALRPQGANEGAYRPGVLIVRLRGGLRVQETTSAFRRLGLTPLRQLRSGDWLVQVPVGEEAATLTHLLNDPDVLYAQPDYILEAK